jgi:hypothetical protein
MESWDPRWARRFLWNREFCGEEASAELDQLLYGSRKFLAVLQVYGDGDFASDL